MKSLLWKNICPFLLTVTLVIQKTVVSKTDHVSVQTEKVTRIYTSTHCIFITTNSQGKKKKQSCTKLFFHSMGEMESTHKIVLLHTNTGWFLKEKYFCGSWSQLNKFFFFFFPPVTFLSGPCQVFCSFSSQKFNYSMSWHEFLWLYLSVICSNSFVCRFMYVIKFGVALAIFLWNLS